MTSTDEKERDLNNLSLVALRQVLEDDTQGLAYVMALREGGRKSAETLISLQTTVKELEDQLDVSTQMILRMKDYIVSIGGELIPALSPPL